jgi:hypothetical protein
MRIDSKGLVKSFAIWNCFIRKTIENQRQSATKCNMGGKKMIEDLMQGSWEKNVKM